MLEGRGLAEVADGEAGRAGVARCEVTTGELVASEVPLASLLQRPHVRLAQLAPFLPTVDLGSLPDTVVEKAFALWSEHEELTYTFLKALLEADPERIAIGQRVEVRFAELHGQGWMPRFEVID